MGDQTESDLLSMTGYAQSSHDNDAYTLAIDVRSVNHRYLDVRVKLPQALMAFERRIKEGVTDTLTRGKVDVTIHLSLKSDSVFQLEVDRPLLRDYVQTVQQVAKEHRVEGTFSVAQLVAFSPAFRVKERDLSDRGDLWETLEPVLAHAMSEHRQMRLAEGVVLKRDLLARTKLMGEYVDKIESLSVASRALRREQLEDKVRELLGAAVEPQPLAMEVARLVERSDIAEEITRARSHFELWATTVNGGGACGKKLDFIVQEMNREFNTMGSKCQDAAITELVIALKSELERVREQVQNIE